MGLFKKIFSIQKKEKDFNLEDAMEEIEEILISSDIGIDITNEIIKNITKQKKKINSYEEMINNIKLYIKEILDSAKPEYDYENMDGLKVLLFFGINGVGKTTTLAKLANYYKNQNKKVLISAADTFRAAAIEQLDEWACKINTDIIKQKQFSDSAAVVFDSLNSALSKNYDYLLIDTAGRMHTNNDLLRELEKINKVIIKKIEEKNLKRLIVIDAQTGQNAFQQVVNFQNLLKIDGIILTKLDSAFKGGTLIKIVKELKIPILFYTFGENIEAIKKFNIEEYLEQIFS